MNSYILKIHIFFTSSCGAVTGKLMVGFFLFFLFSTDILDRFGDSGDDDFYCLIVSLITGFELLLRWSRADMVPTSHKNFFKSATFGLFWCR